MRESESMGGREATGSTGVAGSTDFMVGDSVIYTFADDSSEQLECNYSYKWQNPWKEYDGQVAQIHRVDESEDFDSFLTYQLKFGDDHTHWVAKDAITMLRYADAPLTVKKEQQRMGAILNEGFKKSTYYNDGGVDLINVPPHYRNHPSGVECIQITEHMNFNLGNTVKYIWRADEKHEDPMEDLLKAQFYINREIERINKRKIKRDGVVE